MTTVKRKVVNKSEKNISASPSNPRKHPPSHRKNELKSATIFPTNAPPPSFIDQFFAYLLNDDLADLSPGTRKSIVTSIWHFAATRAPGSISLRLYNPDKKTNGFTIDHTVLEIVSDDRPFILDSVVGCLQSHGLAVHLSIHPVMQITRNAQGQLIELDGKQGAPESLIHVHFDRCLDKDMLRTLEKDVREVLELVRVVVEDRAKMRQRTGEIVAEILAPGMGHLKAEEIEETKSFIDWLNSKNFTYLGYIALNLRQTSPKGWVPLAGSGLGILRQDKDDLFGDLLNNAEAVLKAKDFWDRAQPITILKADKKSRVHRTVPMDAIFVQKYNKDGVIIGHHLLIGLFTSVAYAQSSSDVPLIRKKIETVVTRAHFDPMGHNGRAMMHILDSYPRDELFQIKVNELYDNMLAMIQLQDRPRVALFMRRDLFGRFVTCLVFIPRERYDAHVGARAQTILEKTFHGTLMDQSVRIGNSPLARLFITIRIKADEKENLPDKLHLESLLKEVCKAFPDKLRDGLLAKCGELETLRLLHKYENAFPPTYMASASDNEAQDDVLFIESLSDKPRLPAVHVMGPDSEGHLSLKLYQSDKPFDLSTILPLIENMGLGVKEAMGPYLIARDDNSPKLFLHRFVCSLRQPLSEPFQMLSGIFEEAFTDVLTGATENDAFNALTLSAGLSAREITVLRSFARYLHQLRIPYSHDMMADTLKAHPQLAVQLISLFRVRHDPDLKGDRNKQMGALTQLISQGLSQVDAIEEDRIIRRYLNLIEASLRTNFFQYDQDGKPKPYLAIKFDSRSISFMPLPKPLREIFVTSPRVEAIHLRGGKVARGGIRWSDRRDDFRNEILGLMKAQMVKNTVIVPVGSKGGFIVKQPPEDPENMQAEGIACYQILMHGLLDLTDNRVNNRIVPPPRVVRHDGDDPYLVVAADKGTATFSDIANAISQTYGFWLDDAFASGGSAGYDHKQMGITARGAWEAIKRHFRELGKDIQTSDFTCVGVGDMSGDVFGNAMLLSKHTRLIGAFDHRHIFCDPAPDIAQSYAERKRLFSLPRSSWADYSVGKLSKGGRIFARTDKTLNLTPEIKAAFGIESNTISPVELIQAMLRAPVDLLYFGGIGTYVCADNETDDQVKDRANDLLRVKASELHAKVIGEGANLGLTQRGRIAYALAGGRINTDAIDNSAGVSTSDHEVNIKILLQKLVQKKDLSLVARNKFLASMTEDVSMLVLRDNYFQTGSLSLSLKEGLELLSRHGAAMRFLEKDGLLNRKIEYLPSDAELEERYKRGLGLARPELAVLFAYAKLWLYEKLLPTALLDDPYLQKDLLTYFPAKLQQKYPAAIANHQLKHEILATGLTNEIVNRIGAENLFDFIDRADIKPETVARAFVIARDAFDLPTLWQGIDALDNKLHANLQYTLMLQIKKNLLAIMGGLSSFVASTSKLGLPAKTFKQGVQNLENFLSKEKGALAAQPQEQLSSLISKGVPEVLARQIYNLPLLAAGPRIQELSQSCHTPFDKTAFLYFSISKRLDEAWLRDKIDTIPEVGKRWRQEALNVWAERLDDAIFQIMSKALRLKSRNPKTSDFDLWQMHVAQQLARYDAFLLEMKSTGSFDFAMLTLIHQQLAAFCV